jgi:SPP1 gp7 family putative phage head morphogenesis protein
VSELRGDDRSRARRKKKAGGELGHLAELIAAAPTRCAAAVEELNDEVFKLVEKEGAVNARLILFSLLASTAVPKFARAITELQLHAEMLARLEDPAQSSDAPEIANAAQPVFSALPFDQAVEFFNAKRVMTPDEFAQLEDRYKARGFAIAGVYDRRVLAEAHGVLSDTIATGRSERDNQRALREAFTSAGLDAPDSFQLQTIYDQAILGAYAGGRWAQLTDRDVMRARPYWQYRTAGDNRVRPAHRAMDKKVFPADSPVWQSWYPPNGFRCRCGVDSMSESEVRAQGITVESDVPHVIALPDGTVAHMNPDPGFSGSPATQIAADRTVTAIRRNAQGAGALGQGADDLNRAADRERRARIDHFAGLDEHAVEERLKHTPVFNVARAELPAPGHVEVTWHMYSQNLDTAEQLVTRAVQEKGLFGLRDRIGIASRATYFSDWDGASWPDPEVVYDDALARKLGIPEGRTVARSTEYGLRFVSTEAELPRLLAFLQENGERHGGAPVRRAWDIQDVRLRAGAGAKLPADPKWPSAWLNVLEEHDGREVLTLSREPLKHAKRSEAIAVNASLFEVL